MKVRFNGRNAALIAALVALLALVYTPAAQAAFKLDLSDGINTVSITDNAIGLDGDPTVGNIVFIGAVGPNFTINATQGASKPVVGPGSLFVTSFDVASTGAGVLTIKLTDTDFAVPAGPLSLTQTLTLNTLAGNPTVKVTGYEDNGNVEFAMTNPSPTLTLGALGSQIASSVPYNFTAPYSLTEIATVTFTQKGDIGFTANLTAIPEPASVLLLGGVLLLTAKTVRRKVGRA